MSWNPQYILQPDASGKDRVIAKVEGDRLTAKEYNEILNLLIAQGNSNARELYNLITGGIVEIAGDIDLSEITDNLLQIVADYMEEHPAESVDTTGFPAPMIVLIDNTKSKAGFNAVSAQLRQGDNMTKVITPSLVGVTTAGVQHMSLAELVTLYAGSAGVSMALQGYTGTVEAGIGTPAQIAAEYTNARNYAKSHFPWHHPVGFLQDGDSYASNTMNNYMDCVLYNDIGTNVVKTVLQLSFEVQEGKVGALSYETWADEILEAVQEIKNLRGCVFVTVNDAETDLTDLIAAADEHGCVITSVETALDSLYRNGIYSALNVRIDHKDANGKYTEGHIFLHDNGNGVTGDGGTVDVTALVTRMTAAEADIDDIEADVEALTTQVDAIDLTGVIRLVSYDSTNKVLVLGD